MPTKSSLALVFLAVAAAASGGTDVPSPVQARRILRPPVLDGFLDEGVWAETEPFTAFRQVFPSPGAEPSEKTELRIAYDESHLYFGIRCFDSDPSRISANTMARDAADEFGRPADDVVKILLDPLQDKRNAYVFIINPRGARSEGLASGEHSSFNWDGLWNAKARILSDGWSCEIQIPFKTLPFKPGLTTWGINIERSIARKQETIRLAGIRRDAFFDNAAEAAPLEGLVGLKKGWGLTFRPYGIIARTGGVSAAGSTEAKLDGGFDLYKNITPNFVGAFSYNTDFAETEVDDRRINLTRFSLYFPEKRTFFLEGSEIFDFGTTGGSYDPSFIPFFSRSIGLRDGVQVPISFGTKVFGKVGDTNISVLDVRTRNRDGEPSRNFMAGRIYRNVFEESRIGMIFTDGSPDGTRNSVAGFDGTLKTSRFRGNQNLSAIGWFIYNWNEISKGKHHGFGLKLDYPNDLWDFAATYAYYGDALRPGLGYLPRPGVQSLNLNFAYQPRPEEGFVGRMIRQFFYELRFTFYWDLAGRLETREVFTAPFNVRTESGEHIEFNIIPKRDVLPFDFEVSSGVFLPRGAYNFTGYRFEFNSASHRPWVFDLSWRFGGFYGGHYDDAEIGLTMKFRGTAILAASANVVRGRLPQGSFAENVYQFKADVFLSPDLGLMNYLQYDDVSHQLGLNVRFRWQIRPGNEIYFVYTKNWERRWDPERRFFPLGDHGVFKIQLSIRP